MIVLTRLSDGERIAINPRHIITVVPNGTGATLSVDEGVTGMLVTVVESFDTVLEGGIQS